MSTLILTLLCFAGLWKISELGYFALQNYQGDADALNGWKFESRKCDLWVGGYWETDADETGTQTDIFINFVPCCCLHIWWQGEPRASDNT